MRVLYNVKDDESSLLADLYQKYQLNDEEKVSPDNVRLQHTLIVKDKELFQSFKPGNYPYNRLAKSGNISVEYDQKSCEINFKLIYYLLTCGEDKGLSEYLLNNIFDECGYGVELLYIDPETNEKEYISYSIPQISRAFLSITGKTGYLLSRRAEKLSTFTNYQALRDDYFDQRFITTYRGANFDVRGEELFNILEMSDQEIIDSANDQTTGEAFKVKLYMITQVIKNEHILERYMLDSESLERYHRIEDNSLVDLYYTMPVTSSYMNAYTYTMLKNVALDSSIINAVNDSFMPNPSNLDIIIHVYQQLCSILQYDESLYAYDDVASAINLISTGNNAVNEEMFIALYASILASYHITVKILPPMDITSSINSLFIESNEYKLLVEFTKKDILNNTLEGLTCISKNDITRRKFQETINTKVVQMQNENKPYTLEKRL